MGTPINWWSDTVGGVEGAGDVSCQIAAFWALRSWPSWSRRPAWPENQTRAA